MEVEWEPTDAAVAEVEDAQSGSTEELVGARRRFHRPRAMWVLVVLAGVAGLMTVLVVTHHPRSHPSSLASVTAEPSRTVAPTEAEAAIARIRNLALTPGPLSSYVRATTGGGCVLAKPGVSPQQQISTAVRRAVPSYHVTDVGFIVEATDALCALQLRSRDGRGDVLVVDIVAPPTRPSDPTAGNILFGSRTDRVATIEYASGVMPGGWHVTVGAVGSASGLPATGRLVDLVENPATHW